MGARFTGFKMGSKGILNPKPSLQRVTLNLTLNPTVNPEPTSATAFKSGDQAAHLLAFYFSSSPRLMRYLIAS
jgi:hypothetical protein